MAVERSFVMVKPDGVQRGLIGEVIGRLERRGLKLVAARFVQVTRAHAEKHYAALADKPFFPSLIDFITAGPVLAMAWEGPGAIALIRQLMGATNPANAAPGTIRADYCLDVSYNVIHGSDGPETAAAEIALWFQPEEVVDYTRAGDQWVAPWK